MLQSRVAHAATRATADGPRWSIVHRMRRRVAHVTMATADSTAQMPVTRSSGEPLLAQDLRATAATTLAESAVRLQANAVRSACSPSDSDSREFVN